MKNVNCNNHKIDYVNKKITVSKSFYERACNINNTAEFEEMKKLRAEFPDFEFTVKQIKKNTGKKTYRNLTYKNMEIYIKANEENGDRVLLKFESIKAKSCIQPSPYAYVKSGFWSNIPTIPGARRSRKRITLFLLLKKQKGARHNEKRV